MKYSLIVLPIFFTLSCKQMTVNDPIPQTLTMEELNARVVGTTPPSFENLVNDPLSGPKAECVAQEPSYYGHLYDTYDEPVAPALPAQEPPKAILVQKTIYPEYPFGSPHEGALRVLASKYQTCKILDNVAGTPEFYVGAPEILSEWKKITPPYYPSEGPSCIDSTTLPTKPACQLSVKEGCEKLPTTPLHYAQGWRQTPMKKNTLMVHEAASDCSSFISTAFMASGLKMSPSDTKQNFTSTTSSINSEYKQGTSCFERKKTNDIKKLLEVGSIVNDSSGGHVIMIDYVGADPLGVEAIQAAVAANQISKQDALLRCSQLTFAQMNFGIIHSSVGIGGVGIIRERANAITSGTITAVLTNYARSACTHFITTYPNLSEYDSASGICDTCTILKHKGNKKPGCILEERPKVQGEECINKCLDNYLL